MQRSGPRGPCICGKHCNGGNKYTVVLADPGSLRKVGARDLHLPPWFAESRGCPYREKPPPPVTLSIGSAVDKHDAQTCLFCIRLE